MRVIGGLEVATVVTAASRARVYARLISSEDLIARASIYLMPPGEPSGSFPFVCFSFSLRDFIDSRHVCK